MAQVEKQLSESAIQASCIKWCWNTHPETRGLLFEVNNNPLNGVDGANRRALGMIKGVSDTILLWKGKAYLIEFKDAKGRQSTDQKAWEATVAQQGFNYFLVRDLCSFQELIHSILSYSDAVPAIFKLNNLGESD
jgi:hypothetical protein